MTLPFTVPEGHDILLDKLKAVIGISDENIPPPSPASLAELGGGEFRIRYTILTDAISEFRQYAFATSKLGQSIFQEAYRWIINTDRVWPYSFTNLCEVFGINAVAAREALLKWRYTERQARNAQADQATSEESGCGGSAFPLWGGSDEAQERAEEGLEELEKGVL